MIELQVVPTQVEPTHQKQQDVQLQNRLNYARELLGVSEYSSKRFIKNAIYEYFHWTQNRNDEDRSQYETAVVFLLKHHKPTTTKEAKAVRAQEEADKNIRDDFRAKFYRAERAQKFVVDAELASTRNVLRAVYESLTVNERMSFIKIAGKLFDLNRREKKALDKEDAEARARYEATRTKEKAVRNALEAYYAEKNPTKKAGLWKAYLGLTKEDRQKKAAAKKAEEKRIADGLANVESIKVNDPELWSEAINTAAKATAAHIIGRHFWGATLRDRKGNAKTYAYNVSDTYQKIQKVIIIFSGILAEMKLGVVSEFPSYKFGYLADVCQANKLDERDVIHELHGYATALIDANWSTILAAGSYLLATGEMKSRKFQTIHREATGSNDFRKPAFAFSPAVVSVMMPLPASPPVSVPQPLMQMKGPVLVN
jgi:hypothetical protein